MLAPFEVSPAVRRRRQARRRPSWRGAAATLAGRHTRALDTGGATSSSNAKGVGVSEVLSGTYW